MTKITTAPSENECLMKLTPAEEAFRLASKITPIRANTLQKQPEIVRVEKLEYTRKALVELALFINNIPKEDSIIEAAVDLCIDYNDTTNDELYWFDADGMNKFIKWCETSKNNMFNQ